MTQTSKSLSTAVIAVMFTAALVVLGLWLYRCRDVLTGSDGESNPYAYDIEKFRKTPPAICTEVATWPVAGEKLHALAAGPSNQLFVAVDQSVAVLSLEDGSEQGRFDLEKAAGCLAALPDGRLVVGLGEHIEIYSASGTQLGAWSSLGQQAVITSIAAASNAVYAADYGNRMVWHFATDGRLVGMVGRKDPAQNHPGFIVPSPFFDLVIGPDSMLWVVNPGEQSILNFSADGTILSRWGKAGMEIDAFCGCCNPSHIAMLTDGSFVTSEKGIPRIKLTGPGGTLIGVVAGPDRFERNTTGLDLAVDPDNRILVLDPDRKSIRIFVRKTTL